MRRSNSAEKNLGKMDTQPAPMQSEKRHGSPEFYALLEEMADTHDRKSHDYASDENPFDNYYFSGQMANLFAHSSKDAGFAGRLGEKIYRLANLEGSGKTPKNESIEDTERDIGTITALWMASRRNRRKALISLAVDEDEIVKSMLITFAGLQNDTLQQIVDFLRRLIRDSEVERKKE